MNAKRHSKFRVFDGLPPRRPLEVCGGSDASATNVLSSATMKIDEEKTEQSNLLPARKPFSAHVLNATPSGLVVECVILAWNNFGACFWDIDGLLDRFPNLRRFVCEAGQSDRAVIIFCAERKHCVKNGGQT